jgi:ABC-type uncharacterized transport system substrate-binding protein
VSYDGEGQNEEDDPQREFIRCTLQLMIGTMFMDYDQKRTLTLQIVQIMQHEGLDEAVTGFMRRELTWEAPQEDEKT